jgi:hypothetical protein
MPTTGKRVCRLSRDKSQENLEPDKQSKPLRKRKTRNDKIRPQQKHLEIIKIWTANGMDKRTVAAEIGIGTTTLDIWCREYQEIRRAFETGRKLRRSRATRCLYQQAFPVDGKGNPTCKGNPALMMFWMRTREKYSDYDKNTRSDKGANKSKPLVIEYNIKEQVYDDDDEFGE